MHSPIKTTGSPGNTTSPSKRWATTAHSAMEEAFVGDSIDRARMVSDLKQRKISNTKTSISFGSYQTEYVSDLRASEKSAKLGLDPVERKKNAERIRKMKADLTKTSFNLGDEPVHYESENQSASHVYEAGRAEMLRPKQTSSISFGTEAPQYTSSNAEAMVYLGNMNNFAKSKEDVATLTAQLRKHNFEFGEKPVDYVSDYQNHFNSSKPPMSFAEITSERNKLKDKTQALRKGQFNFGNDSFEYVSNTHRGQLESAAVTKNDSALNTALAADIKRRLQKQSIEILGQDPEYC